MQGEQRVGVLGAERATVGGIAGLQQHRMALRRGRQGGDTAHVELRPAMFDDADAAGVDVDSVLPVGDARRRSAQLSQNSRATVMNSSARL